MASRGLLAVSLLLAVLVATGGARGGSATSTGVFVVHPDPRLCPSPLCGGYWVALANAARTTCANGLRRSRCYVAKAVTAGSSKPVAVPEEALASGRLRSADYGGLGRLGVLAVGSVYARAGTAEPAGGFYRVRDTGLRCVRAPCFSYSVTQVNGSTRTTVAGVDLSAARVTPNELDSAEVALHTSHGLLARGLFVRGDEGERLFRATKLWLRARLPRA
jgi:hypothetical protein